MQTKTNLKKDISQAEEVGFDLSSLNSSLGEIECDNSEMVCKKLHDLMCQELTEQKEFFRQVIDLNPSFIFAKDREGRFTLVNQAVANAFGATVEDIVGKKDSDFNPNLEEVENFRRDDLEVMDSKVRKFVPEEQITDCDGNIRYLQTVKIPIIGKDGVSNQILGVSTDITKRKLEEENRLKLEAQIQHTQKLESLGVLAGGIAHDFNNLLMGIFGNADLLMLDLDSDSIHRKRVEHIRVASKRLAELTNQLLAYSGKGNFQIVNLNLSSVVEEMLNLLQTVISKKAKLVCEFEAGLPDIRADATQIRQVIMNLITNASDSLGSEQGEIFVSIKVKKIKSSDLLKGNFSNVVSDGEYVSVKVKDSGCGMSSDVIEKIFDPFFSTKSFGQGLGLAAVLGIVKSHHGSIGIKSNRGSGTTIEILFPVEKNELSQADLLKKIELQSISKQKRVLVVDDEPTMRGVTKAMLERFNVKVELAVNGQSAIERVKGHQKSFDAIILDLTMPEKDGRETLREIRQLDKKIPVILTSGYTELDATKDFGAGSYNAFLQKPFGPKELMSVLGLEHLTLPEVS